MSLKKISGELQSSVQQLSAEKTFQNSPKIPSKYSATSTFLLKKSASCWKCGIAIVKSVIVVLVSLQAVDENDTDEQDFKDRGWLVRLYNDPMNPR
ncbi:hypothetical protein QTG54_001055 [Skeletonema marinoi]|uniref:Uncharacterized protein n=1 Tax=Skeletonema marinoi TaxID=267567 RepID=A0AAD9DK35_9STRA|nr:hypothetical protein QTG54_001051 [Skeletonema marinoi]KAK1749113.1 hypothetical protein QTG54_001052 [Skeletonema marinoi]KAK1749114.1 hypothetical protein QTG54_001053 [Skeletonema marinoi]KAK1749116.1 hypothetical protein QTG54_001055 [Skeletonema marinoi]